MTFILKEHFNAVENSLKALYKVQKNSGHNLHKGIPREKFISEFLKDHLPESVLIGTGEIIDRKSKSGGKRNQHDIILYRKNFPKLNFGAGISAFLVESVIATIEVKSKIQKSDMRQAMMAAKICKSLERTCLDNKNGPYINALRPYNFVVAYDGPKDIEKVKNWIDQIKDELEIQDLAIGNYQKQSKATDGIVILNKGFLFFGDMKQEDTDNKKEKKEWTYQDSTEDNLLVFFLVLIDAILGSEIKYKPLEETYLSEYKLKNLRYFFKDNGEANK